MPRGDDLQWIEFTDFSPGIHSNNKLAGGVQVTAANPAMAQPANTFRCRALPTGGLGPLPRRKTNFALTTPPGAEAATIYRVCGFNTVGSVFPSPLSGVDSNHRAEIHLALDYYETVADDRYLKWIRERIYNSSPSTETILSRSFLNVGGAGTARFAYLLKTRMLTASPANPGHPVMALLWANNPLGGSNDNRISRIHPDPTAPSTNATVVVGSESEAYTVAAAAQNRLLLGKFLSFDRGTTTGIFTNENFVWTAANLNTLSSSTPAVFVPEIDQLVSDIAAMSANTILVIKGIGGGYMIQGDLDDPTIVQLPNLMCPDGSDAVRGCNTPLGYVYSAGDYGMYVWNGGDQAQPISPQLDGRFATGDITLDGPNGQCDRWGDMLLVPRNWVMDLDKRGWWRIDDPDDIEIRFWSSSRYRSQTYGAVESFLGTETAFALYELDDLAYSYSWQSHPLWVSRDRYVQTREGLIALQGHGTVTVTLIDEDGNEDVIDIEVDSDVIRNFRFNANMGAENLQIRLEAVGEGGVVEAPLIHRLFLGYQIQQQLALNESP